MLRPIVDEYVACLDAEGKGIHRDDPKLTGIQVGNRYKIKVKDYRVDQPKEEDMVSRLFYCCQINEHGVYYFDSWDTDRKLALTWVEILEMINDGRFKEVK